MIETEKGGIEILLPFLVELFHKIIPLSVAWKSPTKSHSFFLRILFKVISNDIFECFLPLFQWDTSSVVTSKLISLLKLRTKILWKSKQAQEVGWVVLFWPNLLTRSYVFSSQGKQIAGQQTKKLQKRIQITSQLEAKTEEPNAANIEMAFSMVVCL